MLEEQTTFANFTMPRPRWEKIKVHFRNLDDRTAFLKGMGYDPEMLADNICYPKPESTASDETRQLYSQEIRLLMRERGHYADCGPICGRCCRPVATIKEMFEGGHATGRCNALREDVRHYHA